jgi:hypothetical protein
MILFKSNNTLKFIFNNKIEKKTKNTKKYKQNINNKSFKY